MIEQQRVIEIKSIVDELTRKLVHIIQTERVQEKIRREIRKQYTVGQEEVGFRLNMNFLPDDERIRALDEYMFENIKGLDSELAERFRKELQQGLMNFESIGQLKERVQKVLKIGKERAELIARTETVRARNMGALDGARQSGLKLKKQWSSQPEKNDMNPCPICDDLNDKTVGLNEQFLSKNGEYLMQPPAHPNCKCTLLFIQT